MDNKVTDYVDFFRQLARRHKDIAHDPLSEDHDSDVSKNRFAYFGNTEIINGLRTRIGPIALCIELYETNLSSEIVYDIKQRPKGSFMVIAQAVQGFNNELQAYAKTEKIILELLQEIWKQHYGDDTDRCTTPFKQFYYSNDSITPTGMLYNNYFGWYVQFEFEFHTKTNISTPPADGIFIA